MWKQKGLQCKPGPETYLWWKLRIKRSRTRNVIFSFSWPEMGVHTKEGCISRDRKTWSVSTRKKPGHPERGLQFGSCIHSPSFYWLSSRSQTRCSKNEVTKTQGGWEVCSITAAKRKPSLLHTRHPQWLCLPRSQPLHLLKPAMKTMTDRNNRDCYGGTSHVSGAWLGFLCAWLFRWFRFVTPPLRVTDEGTKT